MNICRVLARASIGGSLVAAGCGGGATTPTDPVPAASVPSTSLTAAITQAYEQRFGEEIRQPAVVQASGCSSPHVTSTAYLGPFGRSSTLLMLYTSTDGLSVTRNERATVLTPAGTFQVLVVVVRYPQTVGNGTAALLEAAQRQIDDDHASFARARGYSAPIVTFRNTNVFLDASSVPTPRTLSGVTSALSQQGVSAAGYDLVVSINVDPARSEGGFATPGSVPGFIYMGNFSQWRTELSARDVQSIAGAVYHHEVIHHWGWPGSHDWDCNNSYGFNFRVPPILLGWEDVDGDGTAEILDPTPYGRSRR